MCDCMNMAGYGPDSWGKHHHVNCPKYSAEKHPYLFYYEEAVDAYVPVPDKVDGELICTPDQLEEGETMEITFKRVDYTDAEIAALPEC